MRPSIDSTPDRFLTGVDLGGTKIEAIVLSADGTTAARERTTTPSGDYDGTVAAVAALVRRVEEAAGGGSATIGVGTPGSISPRTGLMRNANSTVLNGRRLDSDLAGALGRPVRLANDANCFAIAEARAGAGKAAHTVFGVILGTGVGGGVVVGDHLLVGPNALSGEWGHNPLPQPTEHERPGPSCYCGRTGCIEAWCSGPGLAVDHRSATGIDLTPEAIVGASGGGASDAASTLERHTDRLARSLSMVVNIVDPDIIVLGGGLSNLTHLYRDLPQVMLPHVFSDCFVTPIVQNQLGDSAGVIGAAWLAKQGTT